MATIACCLVVGLGLGLHLVCGWQVVMHTYLCYYRLSLTHCWEQASSDTTFR